MTRFRFIPLVIALAAGSTLIACNTAPGDVQGQHDSRASEVTEPLP